MKQKLARLDTLGCKKVKEEMINQTVSLLLNYRTLCAPNSPPSQLVIPETLKLMPLYILSMLKNPAFKLLNRDGKLDEKVFWA